MSEWRDYNTHLVAGGSGDGNVFHSSLECIYVPNPEKMVDRPLGYLRYHEPDPCEYCHDDVEYTTVSVNSRKVVDEYVEGDD